MKNNSISNLGKLAMIFAAILLQFSCRQEESYDLPSGSTLMNLSVSASNNGATAASDDPASVIKSLCILQFNANGSDFGTLRHVSIGRKTANSGEYSVTLLQSVDTNDKYKLVVVANFPGDDYSIFQRMGGKSYAEVQQQCLSQEYAENNVPAFNDATPFPMFGVVNNGNPMLITDAVNAASVSLVRAVARVDIGVGVKDPNSNKWTNKNVKFDMTEVQIWKAGKQYAYMPEANNFSSASGTLTINKPSAVGGVANYVYGSSYIMKKTYCSEQIYLPEADLKWGTVYDDQYTNRLAIIVGGYYNGSKNLSYYRVDFTNDTSGDKMDILRNHIYQFTISAVKAPGYSSAELAYNSKPVKLQFDKNVKIEKWDNSQPESSPSAISGYFLTFGGLNGDNVLWHFSSVSDSVAEIKKKSPYWKGTTARTYDYNGFYDEGNSFYSSMKIGFGQNGSLYSSVSEAFSYEGVFPNLMVSGNDIVENGDTIPWKDGTALTAFDLCRNLEENGYDDWRLPRLSELAFIYVNENSLKQTRGFTLLNGVYWCGSEYLEGPEDEQRKKSGSAWTVDFPSGLAGHALKSARHKIRCVRQNVNNSN